MVMCQCRLPSYLVYTTRTSRPATRGHSTAGHWPGRSARCPQTTDGHYAPHLERRSCPTTTATSAAVSCRQLASDRNAGQLAPVRPESRIEHPDLDGSIICSSGIDLYGLVYSTVLRMA